MNRRRAAIAASLLLLFVLVLANWTHPTIRLEPSWLNPFAFLAALALPWAAAVYAWRAAATRWTRVAAVALIAPFLLYSSACALFVAPEAADQLREKRDAGFERIASVALTPGRLSVYRTDGGATTSFGIGVRHELKIVPGVILVRHIDSFYPAHDATAKRVGARLVRVSVPYAGEGRFAGPVSRDYRLPRFVYF
jgi:hypothetical protein